MRYRKLAWPGVAVWATLVLASPAALAASNRERSLEARVRMLEARLQQIEGLIGRAPRPVHARAGGAAASTTPGPVTSGVATEAAVQPDTAPAQPAVSAAAALPVDAPQETFVFRENAVTLKPRRVELATQADYAQSSGLLQTDRAFSATTAARVGVFDWLELNATVPSYSATRTRNTGPFRTSANRVGGLGDLQLQANARLHEQTSDTPGVVLSLGTVLPTGRTPYDFRAYQPDPARRAYNPNPTDITAASLTRGAWGLTGNLQFYKTVDPVILFFGVGGRYLFPAEVQGHSVQGGTALTYNMGLSLALSEQSTVGVQVLGSYARRLLVDHHAVPQSEQEPAIVRVSLIQRVWADTWVEPSFSSGLTRDAASLDVGLGLRHRF